MDAAAASGVLKPMRARMSAPSDNPPNAGGPASQTGPANRHEAEIARLSAELDAHYQDRQINLAKMIRAMTDAERRGRERLEPLTEYERQIAALGHRAREAETERDAALARAAAISSSTTWRIALRLFAIADRYPRAKGLARGGMRLLWRAFFRLPGPKAIDPRLGEQSALCPCDDALDFQASVARTLGTEPVPVAERDRRDGAGAAEWPADQPLISVVIPCFNYAHFLGDTLQSLADQTFRDFEIIVVEGGSTSLESREALAAMELRNIRVLLQDSAQRAGENRNFGIRNARGKYICCLDADDYLEPTYLEKTVFYLEHYDYDVVSASLKMFGRSNEIWSTRQKPVLKELLQENNVLTCAVFRRSLWERAGGLHDFGVSEGHVHEDWGFWVRLAALGARFWNLSAEPLLNYRVHDASLSNRNSVSIERHRALIQDYNADILTDQSVGESSRLAEMKLLAKEPLRNLTRCQDGEAAVQPTILIAMPFLIIGGAERLVSSIAAHLKKLGWRIVIVTTVATEAHHGDSTDWFKSATREIYHLPRFLAEDDRPDFIRYLLVGKKIDLVWLVGSASIYDMLPELRRRNANLVVIDLLFNTVGHTRNNRKYAGLIDLTIVENQEVRDWLISRGETGDRIRLIESGVDLAALAPQAVRSQALEDLGIPPRNLVVGFSGRWSDEKDPLGFVEIARRTKAGNVSFVMTGAGHLRPDIEQVLATARLPANKFKLLGAVDDVTDYLSCYDVLCLPSRFDGRPVVVMEALALGIPVMASRVGALPRLVEDGVSGFLFEAGDYGAFVQQIEAIAALPETLLPMKAAARKSAEAHLDSHRMLREFETVLQEKLDGSRLATEVDVLSPTGDGASQSIGQADDS